MPRPLPNPWWQVRRPGPAEIPTLSSSAARLSKTGFPFGAWPPQPRSLPTTEEKSSPRLYEPLVPSFDPISFITAVTILEILRVPKTLQFRTSTRSFLLGLVRNDFFALELSVQCFRTLNPSSWCSVRRPGGAVFPMLWPSAAHHSKHWFSLWGMLTSASIPSLKWENMLPSSI